MLSSQRPDECIHVDVDRQRIRQWIKREKDRQSHKELMIKKHSATEYKAQSATSDIPSPEQKYGIAMGVIG